MNRVQAPDRRFALSAAAAAYRCCVVVPPPPSSCHGTDKSFVMWRRFRTTTPYTYILYKYVWCAHHCCCWVWCCPVRWLSPASRGRDTERGEGGSRRASERASVCERGGPRVKKKKRDREKKELLIYRRFDLFGYNTLLCWCATGTTHHHHHHHIIVRVRVFNYNNFLFNSHRHRVVVFVAAALLQTSWSVLL